MIHIPHELPDEFATEARYITQLTETNHDFKKLVARYNAVNQNIYRIESGEEPTTDEVLEELKKKRLALKDEIAAILVKFETRM